MLTGRRTDGTTIGLWSFMLHEFNKRSIHDVQSQSDAIPNVSAEVTDEELMGRLQRGEDNALKILIQRYSAMLRSIVGRMISNDQDISDVVEEVFLGVWTHSANFDNSNGKVIGWVITMARRRAIDRVRRRLAYDRVEMRFRDFSGAEKRHIAGDNVQAQAIQDDDSAKFAELISQLPAAQQSVVRMAYYDGLSQREIARENGIPLGTVKTRLELGVKKLRVAVCAIGSRDEWLNAAA